MMLVVGDIGGTKTLLALYSPDGDAREPRVTKEYPSAHYPGLPEIVRAFLTETGQQAEIGCFDVAGPVVDGHAHITNLPWTMDEAELARDIGLKRVTLLNDLKAIAGAVPVLAPSDFVTLNPGEPEAHGPIAVVAPGTGLGEAFLVWTDKGYLACASEGGHVGFAPSNARQAALWAYLHQRFGTVSFERVCSGIGIGNLYDFLRDTGAAAEPAVFTERLAGVADSTPLISEAALNDAAGNPLASQTMDLFVEILASEAGNLALKVMATGGVYLAGGIPAHILPRLRDPRFLAAFADKGRLSPILKRIPVHVVTARAALIGSARIGLAGYHAA